MMKRHAQTNGSPAAIRPSHLRLHPLSALLVLGLMASAQAQTLPTGPSVVAGQASVAVQGGQMTVTNTANTILNWQSFSIGASNGVHFAQPNAASQVLNRVTGNDPSAILGSLTSNGRVWLLNPNGVLFGQGARVDVASLVTSTLNLSNEDWLAGRQAFSSSGPAAGIVNQGELRTSLGGRVALVGGTVENQGLISAPGGQVVLAAGRSVELLDTGAPHLTVKVTAPQGEALNLGTLSAAAGRIDVHGAAVNQRGIAQVDSLEAGPGGEIILRASNRLTLADGSLTSAQGQGAASQGGQVQLLGQEVALLDGSRVDASGRAGGGQVLAGGGQQGKDASVPNARALYFGTGASLRADALDSGDGGRLILWSDEATRAYGSLSVRGGAAGGNGGFIETSGGWLDARPVRLDTSAALGRSGTWLLDPYNITISNSPGDTNIGPPTFTATGNASLYTGTVAAALNAGTNVTIDTAGAGNGTSSGSITFMQGDIIVTSPTPGSLRLNADGDITMILANINSQNGPLDVSLYAGRSGQGGIQMSSAGIRSAGGNILLGGFGTGLLPSGASFANAAVGSDTGLASGITLSGATLNAGAGNITLNGITNASATSATVAGVQMQGGTLTGGTITVAGQSTFQGMVGVDLGGDARLTATSGISVDGLGDDGIYMSGAMLEVTGTGPSPSGIRLAGRSTGFGYGVFISTAFSSGTTLKSANSGITIQGGSDGGGSNPGTAVQINGDSPIGAAQVDAGTTLTISVFNSADQVQLSGTNLVSGGDTEFRARSITVSDTVISAENMLLMVDDLGLDGSATLLTGRATGTPLTIRGYNANYTGALRNDTGKSPLSTPDGRWIIHMDNVTSSAYMLGALDYDFRRYNGGLATDLSGYAGNGLIYATPQTASFTASADGKTYDGNTSAIVSSGSAFGVMSDSGTLASGATAAFSDKNAGTGKTVTFTSAEPFDMVDMQGKPVYGYTFQGTMTADINRAPVTVSGTTVSGKVYDAGTAATVGAGTLNGLVGSETLVLTAVGDFNDKNVGTGKLVSISFQLADGSNGGLASNYQLPSADLSLPADITRYTLSVTGLNAQNKVYDTTTAATLTGSGAVTGLSGDLVTLVGTPSAAFTDKNAGTGKLVNVSGYTLSGSDAGNYQLAPVQLSADITARLLSVTGLTAQNKVYDATTAIALTGVATATALSGDTVTLGGVPVGTASSKNVGTAVPVGVSGLVLGGADAGNYQLAPSTLSANITPYTLSVTGLTAQNRVYNGNTNATLAGTGAVTGLGADVVALAGTASASFGDKNVGTGKGVAVTGLGLSGADAGNYQLAPLNLTANITPYLLSVAGLTVRDKVYDGNTSAQVAGSGSVAGLGSDVVTLAGSGSAAFTDKNVGTAKAVTLTGYTLAGADAGNYLLNPVQLTAAITPAVLTYVATPATVPVGAPLQLTGTVTGFVAGETQASATTGTLAFQPVAPVTVPGQYAVQGSGLSAQNYSFVQAAGNATALTLVGAGPAAPQAQAADASTERVRDTAPVAAPPPSPLSAGLVDLTVPLPAAAPAPANARSFAAVRVDDLSMDALRGLLDARDRYKKELFAESLTRLEQNPALADLRACQRIEEAASGTCLITDTLKQQAGVASSPAALPVSANAQGTTVAPSVVAPQPALVATPSTSSTSSTSSTPAAAPAPVVAAAPLFTKQRVRSAALPQIERKVALLIGVNDYADASIPKLSNAVGDAQAMGQLFQQQLGYETVVLPNASKASVVGALNRLALELGPRDSVVVYYAGHGELVESSGQGYWQLADSDAKRPETWLSNADIARLVGQVNASQVALISDSCYSGALAAGERIRATPGTPDPTPLLAQRSAVVMSSGGNEPVADEGKGGHSPFAFSLINNLKDLSKWQAGGNVFERVRFAVARQLPQRPQYSAATGHQRGGDYLFEQRQLENQ